MFRWTLPHHKHLRVTSLGCLPWTSPGRSLDEGNSAADLQVAKGSTVSFEQPEMFLGGVEGAGPGFKEQG